MSNSHVSNNSISPIRVSIVGPSEDLIGGQAVIAARLCSRLAEINELEVTFIPVNPRLPGILRSLQRVKYVRTVVTSLAYFLLLLIRIPRTDVVHAFSASYWSFLLSPVPAMIIGRLFRKGVILNYHSGEADDHLTRWRSAIPLAKLAHSIVVPSDYLREVFARHGLRAKAVPNFVELNRFPYRKRNNLRPEILCNRMFEHHYNVSCSLRAFQQIQARISNARIGIAGDGPLRSQLEREARDLKLRNVTFFGAVGTDEMATLYNEADIYLNTSDIDNMPGSILEAAACGLPIVTTDVGGIPFMVENEVTALLIPRDDDSSAARAVFRLLEHSTLARRIAVAARVEVLKRYTWNAAEPGWLDVYALAAKRETLR